MSRRGRVAIGGPLAWGGFLLVLGLGGLLMVHDVPTALSADDLENIARITAETGKSNLAAGAAQDQPFETQIALAKDIQDAVLSIAPKTPVDEATVWNASREIRDLYRERKGTCFDRSRAIEKMLTFVGLDVRHATVFATDRTGSALASVVTPGSTTHAVTEVRTQKGWMVVDSNDRWMSLTQDGEPLSLAELQHRSELWGGPWNVASTETPNTIFRRSFTYVLGLYSRHGRFYPPFTPIPDVNWHQLTSNLTD